MSDTKPTVLFVCVHNAGRSQMAAGWLRHLARRHRRRPLRRLRTRRPDQPGRRRSHAGGRHRHHGPNPDKLTWDTAQGSDVIITMGCGDACPVFLGKRYEDWTLDDPAGKDVDAVRPIRDEIRERIQKLLTDHRSPHPLVPRSRPPARADRHHRHRHTGHRRGPQPDRPLRPVRHLLAALGRRRPHGQPHPHRLRHGHDAPCRWATSDHPHGR
jgi:arsenate reductase